MISQQTLNLELDLAKRIYLYYFDKMADYMSVGSDNYLSWYKDLNVLYFLTSALKSVYIKDDELYLGDTVIDEDDYFSYTSSVREYINYDLREILYAELDTDGNIKDSFTPNEPPVIVTYQTFIQDWRSTVIEITVDDTTELTLPFNISDVDAESVRVTVNDGDPVPSTDPQSEGYHIIGATLYWHEYYNLKAGDKVYIQYLLNIS